MSIQAKSAPNLNLPKGSRTCEISIINTTCDLVVPPGTLVEPKIPGHEYLNLPTVAFYIKHSSGAEVLFDMGCRSDWDNLVPHVAEVVSERVPGLRVTKDVPVTLKDGGVDPSNLKALILSHWHFDHCGDISTLNPKTDLVVGPGFKERFLPGYPAKEDSGMHEADFKDRNVVEIAFSDSLKIGGYQAHDYFDDGSLYILNVPGHTTGHISALVRTTPDTFAFLGGDVCHFVGVIRPSSWIPLPETIPAITELNKRIPQPAPCSAFTECHPDQDNPRTTAFYQCSADKNQSWYDDPATAMQSIRWLFDFDAQPNVLVIIAHDTAPLATMNFFPNGTINNWQSKGWKEKMHWYFLNELPVNDGKTVGELLVDGLYKDGKKIKNLDKSPA
ncbi:unnamed protein product [Zymoseptoria tritici ST99CH_1A5]|uniref:Metallo-beta-lactamase domain-containing protein n=3 Tax=Zymoseptoria tritici TaxID=1047171 RepID=F9XDJ6_ZYMTI|nr:uncharacterized protein MYCGRDRAFT_73202 [Zymoseptoria tritici IPO323]EGP86507.1 hypothetical protein MYCGRDRAFT_73202 [Zymoseptoria tritici IPO323]SMR54142.1 unnamed protein product [Zymoseptoria tritici ST99CH_1E4]SMY25435.1 unnamed protein product [Zymoseptoria tritici ST99CH_1A5]